MLEEEADEDTYHNISLHLNAWVAFPEGEDEDLSQMTDMERKCAHHFTVSALNFNVPPDLPSPEDLEDMGIDVGNIQ